MKMQYALVNGIRHEPEPKLRGTCPNCDAEVVAKCGQQRVWHWAHLGKLECDHWWEPETEWHRAWKALFPKDWHEVVHVAPDGERHIADLKSRDGLVVEFQHSPITPSERLSRESFYQKMVWVADGTRYLRDVANFHQSMECASVVRDSPMYLRPARQDAALFRRWIPIKCPVFIDFGSEQFRPAGLPVPDAVLWQLLVDRSTGSAIVAAVTRESFVQYCTTGSALQHLVVHRTPPKRPQRRRYYQQRQQRYRF
jgi:competence protein CoiA